MMVYNFSLDFCPSPFQSSFSLFQLFPSPSCFFPAEIWVTEARRLIKVSTLQALLGAPLSSCPPCQMQCVLSQSTSTIPTMSLHLSDANNLNSPNRGLPHPLGTGPARPNPKMAAPETEILLCIGFAALRGGLRPWSRKGPDHGVGVDPILLINGL